MLTGGSPGPANHHAQHNDLRRPPHHYPMRTDGQRTETPNSVIERVSERLIEQRHHTTARFDTDAFERDRKARWKLAGRRPHALLIVLPAELPVHPQAMNHDHYRADSNARMIIALAVVAPTTAQNTATKFYFRYHAQAFEARVFDREEDAREWLIEIVDGV